MSDSVRPHRRKPTRLPRPWDAPPSLGFSRQEHWSGLPFPSPMRESEKWKGSRSVVSNSQRPHGLQPSRLLRPWDFPGKSTGVGCHCLLWLTCEMCAIVQQFEHSLALPLLGIGMKTDLFQSCGHCWVFQICGHVECSTYTASSFRIWNSSTGIPSPPLALFIVMLPETPWLHIPGGLALGEWSHHDDYLGHEDLFLYSSLYSWHLFLISSASVRSIPFLSFVEPIFAWNVPLVSLIFLKRSLVFTILLFSSIFCTDHWGSLSYLSLLFFGTWHSKGYIFFFCLRRVYLGFLLPQLKLKYLPDPIIFGKS